MANNYTQFSSELKFNNDDEREWWISALDENGSTHKNILKSVVPCEDERDCYYSFEFKIELDRIWFFK